MIRKVGRSKTLRGCLSISGTTFDSRTLITQTTCKIGGLSHALLANQAEPNKFNDSAFEKIVLSCLLTKVSYLKQNKTLMPAIITELSFIGEGPGVSVNMMSTIYQESHLCMALS